jgi:hypothetical protein
MATQPPAPGTSPKVCYHCGKDNSDQSFCGACGSPLALSEYLSTSVKKQLADTIQDRDVLERESSVKIFERVWGWMKLMFGIVAALLVFTGVNIFWKASDFSAGVDKAKQSVTDTAKKSVDDISQISSQSKRDLSEASKDIKETHDAAVKLKEQIVARSAEVQTLGTRIKDSDTQLAAFKTTLDSQAATFKSTVDSQEQQLRHLTDEVRVVKTTRN